MQHYARILADRVEHDRAAEFGHYLAHYLDRFGFKPPQVPGEDVARWGEGSGLRDIHRLEFQERERWDGRRLTAASRRGPDNVLDIAGVSDSEAPICCTNKAIPLPRQWQRSEADIVDS
jgi:hypothetical protein